MARGPAPKPPELRRNRNPKMVGDWKAAPGIGWQHGDTPKPPAGLLKVSRETWDLWFGSWVASFWSPEDVPGLGVVIELFDQVKRGEFQRANELRLQMDGFGLTKKGQQQLRWMPPAADDVERVTPKSKRRHNLKVV